MARLARTVVAGLPHHVAQRGNRREAIFFEVGDPEVWLSRRARPESRCGRTVTVLGRQFERPLVNGTSRRSAQFRRNVAHIGLHKAKW